MRNPEKLTINEMIALLHDQPFCVSRDIIRNIRTLLKRVANEGMAFLTKLLPAFGKAFDQAITSNLTFSPCAFFRRAHGTCFPHFLGSALKRVFDSNGNLLAEPCYDTVRWIRTFCFYCYKIEVPFSQEDEDKYSSQFVETDESIGAFHYDDDTLPLRNLMRKQLSELSIGSSQPRFGPGISSNCRREEKYLQYVPPSALRTEFGWRFFHHHDELAAENLIHFVASLMHDGYDRYEKWVPNPSKILFVPKDSRGPRTICCEDSRLMFAQKSLQVHMYSQVESSDRFGGRVNFTDQSINKSLTFDKSYATIDLKDASDRVSLDLVKCVFPPKLLSAMMACRSETYVLPNGNIGIMKKFAPMGSALCFPVMALVAYTAITSAIYLAGGSIPRDQKRVFVYGDDIVVPNEYAYIAMSSLESIGLLVNRGKSFVNSRFTESCGQDTLDQTCVTPLRKKKLLFKPERITYKSRRVLSDVNGGYPHHVALINSAKQKGFKNLALQILVNVERLYGPIPYGLEDSPYINVNVDSQDVYPYNAGEGHEVNGKLRGYVVRDKDVEIRHTGYSRLRRNLLESNPVRFDSLESFNCITQYDSSKIGARSTFLQKKTFTRWGRSYA